MPFSPDDTPTIAAPAPNIVTKLEEFATIGRMSAEQQVYTLPWLLHLAGDIHQPLHVLQRFTQDFPRGDRGGNAVRLGGTSNLHSYWDSRLGTSQTERFLTQLVETIERRHPAPRQIDLNPTHWADESFKLKDQVYAFTGRGTRESPAEWSDAYAVKARDVAYGRR